MWEQLYKTGHLQKALSVKKREGVKRSVSFVLMNLCQTPLIYTTPVDRDAAANKNYVDNGGAIVKNPDGSFNAVSDIDFFGYRLKNLSNPKEDRDAVNKIYVDKKLSLPSLIGPKPIITVWAEEKGPLGDGHYEFSFGNGSSGSEHAYGGYCMSAPGRIIRGSLTVTEQKKKFCGRSKG